MISTFVPYLCLHALLEELPSHHLPTIVISEKSSPSPSPKEQQNDNLTSVDTRTSSQVIPMFPKPFPRHFETNFALKGGRAKYVHCRAATPSATPYGTPSNTPLATPKVSPKLQLKETPQHTPNSTPKVSISSVSERVLHFPRTPRHTPWSTPSFLKKTNGSSTSVARYTPQTSSKQQHLSRTNIPGIKGLFSLGIQTV